MKKIYVLAIAMILSVLLYSQEETKPDAEGGKNPQLNKDDIPFEKPINIFAAGGAAYRIGEQYSVSITPTDYTVQFQSINPITTRLSLGLVWNPIKNFSKTNIDEYFERKAFQDAAKAARNHMAIALLVNVFKLGYSADDFEASSPIDVGFGVGFRETNFLALLTIEFTPVKTPTDYFIENYKGQNKQLILAGNSEPERDINVNSSLFYNKIYPSIGFKIAYTFSNKLDKPKE